MGRAIYKIIVLISVFIFAGCAPKKEAAAPVSPGGPERQIQPASREDIRASQINPASATADRPARRDGIKPESEIQTDSLAEPAAAAGGPAAEQPAIQEEINKKSEVQEVTQKGSSFSFSGYSRKTDKKWEVTSRTARFKDNFVYLEKVKARSYNTEGTLLNISADEGKFDKQNKNVHLENNVRIVTQEGAELQTDSLDWNAQKGEVENSSLCLLEKDSIRAKGKGLFALSGLNTVHLKEDVEVTVTENPETSPTVITCEGQLELNYEKNIAVFNKNVYVTDSRGKIRSDKLEVYFDSETDEILELIATGNVEIEEKGRFTTTQRAVYDRRAKKLTLTGKPKIVIYSTEKEKD